MSAALLRKNPLQSFFQSCTETSVASWLSQFEILSLYGTNNYLKVVSLVVANNHQLFLQYLAYWDFSCACKGRMIPRLNELQIFSAPSGVHANTRDPRLNDLRSNSVVCGRLPSSSQSWEGGQPRFSSSLCHSLGRGHYRGI